MARGLAIAGTPNGTTVAVEEMGRTPRTVRSLFLLVRYDSGEMSERHTPGFYWTGLCGIVLLAVLGTLVFLPIWRCPGCDVEFWKNRPVSKIWREPSYPISLLGSLKIVPSSLVLRQAGNRRVA